MSHTRFVEKNLRTKNPLKSNHSDQYDLPKELFNPEQEANIAHNFGTMLNALRALKLSTQAAHLNWESRLYYVAVLTEFILQKEARNSLSRACHFGRMIIQRLLDPHNLDTPREILDAVQLSEGTALQRVIAYTPVDITPPTKILPAPNELDTCKLHAFIAELYRSKCIHYNAHQVEAHHALSKKSYHEFPTKLTVPLPAEKMELIHSIRDFIFMKKAKTQFENDCLHMLLRLLILSPPSCPLRVIFNNFKESMPGFVNILRARKGTEFNNILSRVKHGSCQGKKVNAFVFKKDNTPPDIFSVLAHRHEKEAKHRAQPDSASQNSSDTDYNAINSDIMRQTRNTFAPSTHYEGTPFEEGEFTSFSEPLSNPLYASHKIEADQIDFFNNAYSNEAHTKGAFAEFLKCIKEQTRRAKAGLPATIIMCGWSISLSQKFEGKPLKKWLKEAAKAGANIHLLAWGANFTDKDSRKNLWDLFRFNQKLKRDGKKYKTSGASWTNRFFIQFSFRGKIPHLTNHDKVTFFPELGKGLIGGIDVTQGRFCDASRKTPPEKGQHYWKDVQLLLKNSPILLDLLAHVTARWQGATAFFSGSNRKRLANTSLRHAWQGLYKKVAGQEKLSAALSGKKKGREQENSAKARLISSVTTSSLELRHTREFSTGNIRKSYFRDKETAISRDICDAHIVAIRKAKKYLLMENQYLHGAVYAGDHRTSNPIPDEIIQNIVEGHKSGNPFFFEYTLPKEPMGGANASWENQAVLRKEWKTIAHMIKQVNKLTGGNAHRYMRFNQLMRNKSEMIYVHSKCLIADDGTEDGINVIISSANNNERSMRGDNDTEIGLFLESKGNPQMNKKIRSFMREMLSEWHGTDIANQLSDEHLKNYQTPNLQTFLSKQLNRKVLVERVPAPLTKIQRLRQFWHRRFSSNRKKLVPAMRIKYELDESLVSREKGWGTPFGGIPTKRLLGKSKRQALGGIYASSYYAPQKPCYIPDKTPTFFRLFNWAASKTNSRLARVER
jgi:phosphatidylserine/phosphatidylglycerophosphate/cardiolipin synthase-like enzyme